MCIIATVIFTNKLSKAIVPGYRHKAAIVQYYSGVKESLYKDIGLVLLQHMLQFSNQRRSKITHDDCVQTQKV